MIKILVIDRYLSILPILAFSANNKRTNYKEARPPEAPLEATYRSDSVGNAGKKQQSN